MDLSQIQISLHTDSKLASKSNTKQNQLTSEVSNFGEKVQFKKIEESALKDKNILQNAIMESNYHELINKVVDIEKRKISDIKDPRKKLMAIMLKAKAKKEREAKE